MATVLSTWEQLLEKALQLPSDDQKKLARALYENAAADDDDDDSAEWEAAWAEEIKRRVEEFDSGTAELIPAEQVFAEARARVEQIAKARVQPR